MLATTISKYLKENRRLVIPQLGAFLVKEPGHTVLFSQLLTKDDGVLQNLLIESGMSDVEASGAISRLLFNIRFVSENGGKYWISGVGHFSKGENGALQFEFDPTTTPSASYASEQQEEEEEKKTEEIEEPIIEPTQDAPTEEVTMAEAGKTITEEQEPEEEACATAETITIAQRVKVEEATETTEAEETEETTEEATEEVTEAEASKASTEEPPTPAEQLEEIEPQQERPQKPSQMGQSLEAAPEEYRHIHFEPDPDLEGLSYGGNGKRSRRRQSTQSKKLDWWMIIAVSAALLALSVILYGFLREGAQGSPIAARVEQRAK